MLCERGIRGFGQFKQFIMDVSANPVIKRFRHLPIIADPSHSTGKRYLAPRVAAAVGAHGLLIEAHPNPDVAKCDGAQSWTFQYFTSLMGQVQAVASVMQQPVNAN